MTRQDTAVNGKGPRTTSRLRTGLVTLAGVVRLRRGARSRGWFWAVVATRAADSSFAGLSGYGCGDTSGSGGVGARW
jgi:hypothetical protein